MKKIFLVGILSLIGGFGYAQQLKESDVPGAVKAQFSKSYPKAKEVKWSKEGVSEFEAEFENGSLKQSANFDQTGKWLVTETVIKKSDLPAPVQATISRDFPGYKIEEAEKAESSDQGVFYEVELEKGEMNYEVRLSAGGNVLKKDEIKEKGEKKD